MISDILSQTVVDLDHYLTDQDFDRAYDGELRERLIRLRDEAENIRGALDARADDRSRPKDRQSQEKAARRAWVDWMLSDESAHMVPSGPSFSQSDLLRRGWTKRLIDQLLGQRDFEATNPHGAGFKPMLCWREDRVLAAEDTAAFREHRTQKRG